MRLRKIVLILSLFLFLICENSEKYKIIDKTVKFTKIRKNLTLRYLRRRYGIKTNSIEIIPRMIILHWTDGDLQSTFNTFMRERVYLRGYGWAMNVVTQFVVGRDGTIYRLMPENWVAHHTIGLNWVSVGIENVGSEKNPLTEEQLYSNLYLIRYLKEKYPAIEYVIGHCEYRLFEGHELWLERTNRRTYKVDPGKRFLNKIREYIEYLGFKELPDNSKQEETCYDDL